MGATATGKSQLAIDIAQCVDGEVISIDSRQVYRGMDIGTAKVLPDERGGIAHHLIDIMNPDEINSAGLHAGLAKKAIEDIEKRKKVPILAGGTGLYFRALFRGLMNLQINDTALRAARESFVERSTGDLYCELQRVDAARARSISPKDRMRISRALEVFIITGKTMTDHILAQDREDRIDALIFVLTMPRFDLRDIIARRTRAMFRAGWIDEVRGLIAAGYAPDAPGMVSLGYQEIAGALESGRDPAEEIDTIITHTRQYAKRQETFFRSETDAISVDVLQPAFSQHVFEKVSTHFHFKNNLT
jgi:tRNA dimethylallyltransferase